MQHAVSDFFTAALKPLAAFNAWAAEATPWAKADHIGYKCADHAEFTRHRAMFDHESAFMYQSIIAGRPIAVIKLLEPLQTALGEIRYLELSDQKPDGSQTSGFDHLEIYPIGGTVEDLVSGLESKGIRFEEIERPHHTTYDREVMPGFKVRLEAEPLIEKIKRSEMRF